MFIKNMNVYNLVQFCSTGGSACVGFCHRRKYQARVEVAVATNALAYIKAVLLTTLKCVTHESGVNIDNITFISLISSQKARPFPRASFQATIIFASKTGAYLTGPPDLPPLYGQAPRLTHIYQTNLKTLPGPNTLAFSQQ